jgi:hypothetical protein
MLDRAFVLNVGEKVIENSEFYDGPPGINDVSSSSVPLK